YTDSLTLASYTLSLHDALPIYVLPVVFFGPTSMLATTYYQISQEPFQIAIRTIIFGIMIVLLNVYFIAILKMGYMGWFLSSGIRSEEHTSELQSRENLVCRLLL